MERVLERIATSMLSTQYIVESAVVVCDAKGWNQAKVRPNKKFSYDRTEPAVKAHICISIPALCYVPFFLYVFHETHAASRAPVASYRHQHASSWKATASFPQNGTYHSLHAIHLVKRENVRRAKRSHEKSASCERR